MTKRTRKTEVEAAEAALALGEKENEASYLARGRRLKYLTDEVLRERWITYLRREFIELAEHRTEGNDISAELSIRGTRNVGLPVDVMQIMFSELRKRLQLDELKILN